MTKNRLVCVCSSVCKDKDHLCLRFYLSRGSCIQGAEGREGAFEAGGLIMLVQVTLECEGLVATFTLEVLEGRVGLHVSAQV